MRRHVSTWEELPKGVWLDNDEHGVHWYQANDGTYWHSTDDGYRVWEEVVKESRTPFVQPSTPKSQYDFEDDYFPEYDFDEDDDDDDYQSGSFRRRKSRFFTVFIVLIILSGGGAAGYFIYDFFKKDPMDEFYGTTYWGSSGGDVYGYLFTGENRFEIITFEDEGCDSDSKPYRNSNFLCIFDYTASLASFDVPFSLVENSDNYEICIDGNDCVKLYPLERGLVVNAEGDCTVMVSDIGNPTFTPYDDGDIASYVLSESWKSEFQEIKEDIEKNLSSGC